MSHFLRTGTTLGYSRIAPKPNISADDQAAIATVLAERLFLRADISLMLGLSYNRPQSFFELRSNGDVA
jgi:hypothetical protein